MKTLLEHLAEVGEVPDELGYLHHDKMFDMPACPEDKRDIDLIGSGHDLRLVIDGGCKGNRLAFINDIENTKRAATVKAVRGFGVRVGVKLVGLVSHCAACVRSGYPTCI